MREALIEKYRPDDIVTSEEKESLRKLEDEELYVNTDAKGMKKIEVMGVDMSYKWRSNIKGSREIALEFMKISDLGVPGSLASTIPHTMYMYLDKNLLHSWD